MPPIGTHYPHDGTSGNATPPPRRPIPPRLGEPQRQVGDTECSQQFVAEIACGAIENRDVESRLANLG